VRGDRAIKKEAKKLAVVVLYRRITKVTKEILDMLLHYHYDRVLPSTLSYPRMNKTWFGNTTHSGLNFAPSTHPSRPH